MIEVTIHIPALSELAAAIRGFVPPTGAVPQPESAPAPAKEKSAPAKAEKKEKPAPAPAPAPVEETPPPAPAKAEPAPAAAPSAAEDAVAITKDKIRQLYAENEANPAFKAKARELIKEKGGKNISTLPDDVVDEVLNDLEDYIASL